MKTKTFSRLILFLSLLLAGGNTQADPADAMPVEAGTIRGKVTDAKTREPMQFVNVSVRHADSKTPLKGMVTDAAGNFTIVKLPEGNYTLNISFIGYKSVEKNFALSKQNPGINFRNIPLEEDSQMLGEVKVTGQRPQMKFEID